MAWEWRRQALVILIEAVEQVGCFVERVRQECQDGRRGIDQPLGHPRVRNRVAQVRLWKRHQRDKQNLRNKHRLEEAKRPARKSIEYPQVEDLGCALEEVRRYLPSDDHPGENREKRSQRGQHTAIDNRLDLWKEVVVEQPCDGDRQDD